jgi:peptidoglycan/LPS O-acetylase OafA/YrhL
MAATSVLFQHTCEAAGFLGFHKNEFGGSWMNFGEIGVLAFFLVSGFVIPLSVDKTKNLKKFWTNRTFRIYPLYLFICIVTLVARYFITGLPPDTIPALLCHPIFIQEWVGKTEFVGGAWTLFLELIWYAFYSVIFLISLNKRGKILVVAICCLALLASVVPFITGFRMPMGRVNFMIIFIWGYTTYRYIRSEIAGKEYTILSAFMALTILWGLYVGFGLYPSNAETSPSMRCVMLSWFIGGLVFFVPVLTRTANIWKHSAFSSLGKISYSVYLTHGVIILIIKSLLPFTGFPFLIVTIPMVLGVSIITYRYIEAPAVAYSHRLVQRA